MALSKSILRWSYKLSWKKILGINALLLLVITIPLVINAALNPTRTRSEAALLHPEPISTEFEAPSEPPEIYLVDHFFGKEGDAVLIHGSNLGGWHEDSWVSLSGKKISEENLVTWADNFIEFKVPEETVSGPVEVNILGQRTMWEGTFYVIDENTETELRLENGKLAGKGLTEGKELMVWLLIMSGEKDLKITRVPGINLKQTIKDLPIGRIYEIKLSLTNSDLLEQSYIQFVDLLKIEKTKDQLIGLAQAELMNTKGELIPLMSHPLYVSF